MVGKDIKVTQIPKLEGHVLVGNFSGGCFSVSSITDWMDVFWNPHLGYTPVFSSFISWMVWVCF
jgi:hypothetical protein